MLPLLLPFQLVLLMFAGWVNRHQLDVIEYLQEENRVLKERLGGRRLCFTDAERCRLARKAQSLGRKVLSELETSGGAGHVAAVVPEIGGTQMGL
jgi:putative transposase